MAGTKINSAAPIQHDKNANFAHNEVETGSHVQLLPKAAIAFDENVTMRVDIDALCSSVHERGFDKPLMVRKVKDKHYAIIDGNARYICATALGINTVPAIVVQMSAGQAKSYRDQHDREKLAHHIFGLNFDTSNETLCAIAEMMEHERALNIEIDELDRIADGLEMDDESILFIRNHWFDHVLESLNWWWLVSDTLLGSKQVSDDGDGFPIPEPTFAHHREALSKLLNDTVAAFVPAWQEHHYFTTEWPDTGDATRELLKRYRTFTRYVGAFAQELWPDANVGPLLNRA